MKKYTLILFAIILGLSSCVGGIKKKHYCKHNLIFSIQGYTNQMLFYNETNPYYARVTKNGNEFTLIVTDTISGKEYILNSDRQITIKGGDIKYKNQY